MKIFIVILGLFSSMVVMSQDNKSISVLKKMYAKELKLTKEQLSDFVIILKKYKKDLYRKNINNKDFNRLNKSRDLEFYYVLNEVQFIKFRKIKLNIEPELRYKPQ
jgi:hypothetical protein